MKKNKKKMSGGMKAAIVILLVIAAGLLGFSAYKLIGINNTYKEANDLYDDIAAIVSATTAADQKKATEPKTEAPTTTTAAPETEPETEPEVLPSAEAEPETMPGTVTAAAAADPAAVSESIQEDEPETVSETALAAEADPETETAAETEAVTETVTETVSDTVPETVTEAAATQSSERVPETEAAAAEVAPEPAAEAEPETKATPETVTEPTAEAEPETKATPETVTEPAAEAAPETKATPETVTEPAAEAEPETKAAAETVTEAVTEPAAETEQKPASDVTSRVMSAGHNAQVIFDEYGEQPLQILGGDPAEVTEDIHYQTLEDRGENVRTAFHHFRFASMFWNFDALYQLCEDSVGWIYGDDTPISYPVVQGETNDQYLRHMINGQYNVAGTLFVDSRFEQCLDGNYATIYGHNMDDKSMFGSITSYKDEEYYKEHPEIEIYIRDKMYAYEVYAAFQVHIDSFFFSFFDDPAETEEDQEKWEEDFDQLLKEIEENRTYETQARALTRDSHIVALITCIDYPRDYNYRYVVILVRGDQLLDPSLKKVIDPYTADAEEPETEEETEPEEKGK